MLPVDEGIFETKEMVVGVLVKLGVELQGELVNKPRTASGGRTYQIQDGHLHHTLIEVCCPVFDHLDGDNLLRLQILTFHDLTECALAENIKDQIAVPRSKC